MLILAHVDFGTHVILFPQLENNSTRSGSVILVWFVEYIGLGPAYVIEFSTISS